MMPQRVRYGLGALLLLALLLQAGGWLRLPFVDGLERAAYDLRLRLTLPRTPDPRIVILDIDEKSLADIGRWPWSRHRMAALVNRLFDTYHVRALGLDIVMAEADRSSGLDTLRALRSGALRGNADYAHALQQLGPSLDYDGQFAAALRQRPVVLGYYFANEGISSGLLPPPTVPGAAQGGPDFAATTWQNYGANLSAFQQAASGAGHVNPIIDADGSVRRVPLLARHHGAYYEAFALAMVRAALPGSRVVPELERGDDGLLAAVRVMRDDKTLLRVPVDDMASAWVPYRGPKGSFRYLSVADVMADRIPRAALEGKIVILGTSAPGLQDLRATPVGETYPGMEVHANLISGMLSGTVRQTPAYAEAIALLLLLAVGLPLWWLLPRCTPLRASLLAAAALVVVVGSNLAAWQRAGLVLPLAGSLLLIVGLYVVNMSAGYFLETRARRLITRRFGQYVPPALVEQMSRRPEAYSMEGRKAQLTVLFSDVRDFTSLSETLPPEDLSRLMNEYLTAMTVIIQRHRGTLDKYIGDAIVAFWGAPMDDPDHARNTVLAALAMQTALTVLNRSFVQRGWPALRIGIGINTGEMIVGDMGSSIRLAYTVLGDAANLGARLESKSKEYGVGILAGARTRAAVPDIVWREVDRVQVKGKQEAVTVYEPLGREEEVSPAMLAALQGWHDALGHYRARDWTRAEGMIRTLAAADPECALYRLYLTRIAAFRHTPPEDGWDGVTRFATK